MTKIEPFDQFDSSNSEIFLRSEEKDSIKKQEFIWT